MPTRSTRLASLGPAANTYVTAFTVPNGYTYIVKEVIASSFGGAGDTLNALASDAVGIQAYVLKAQAVGANARAEWDGWLAMNQGDIFQVFSLNGNTHYWISGAKLPGVA